MNGFDEAIQVVRDRVWAAAEEANWDALSQVAKSAMYAQWTEDPSIGGVLARYMAKGKVRVYIKDTLLKSFTREKMEDIERPKRVLRIPSGVAPIERFIKPHGALFEDRTLISWGPASEWKHILMATFERSVIHKAVPSGAVFFNSGGRFQEGAVRALAAAAAEKLGIKEVVWL